MEKEKMEKKLAVYIENIEQLGADARYHNNYESYDKLIIDVESIEYWAKKAAKLAKKLKEGEK